VAGAEEVGEGTLAGAAAQEGGEARGCGRGEGLGRELVGRELVGSQRLGSWGLGGALR